MNLRAASTPPCENVIFSLRITLHLTYELGPKGMLESYDVNEAVLNVRTRVESLEHVRICVLNSQRKLVSSLKDKPTEEESEKQECLLKITSGTSSSSNFILAIKITHARKE